MKTWIVDTERGPLDVTARHVVTRDGYLFFLNDEAGEDCVAVFARDHWWRLYGLPQVAGPPWGTKRSGAGFSHKSKKRAASAASSAT